MFSLDLAWLEKSRESLLNPWQANAPVYAEGEAYSNPIFFLYLIQSSPKFGFR